jgi:hypothetical protein
MTPAEVHISIWEVLDPEELSPQPGKEIADKMELRL